MSIHPRTIDDPQNQRYIVDIMKGGDEAFNRRKNIYSILIYKRQQNDSDRIIKFNKYGRNK